MMTSSEVAELKDVFTAVLLLFVVVSFVLVSLTVVISVPFVIVGVFIEVFEVFVSVDIVEVFAAVASEKVGGLEAVLSIAMRGEEVGGGVI